MTVSMAPGQGSLSDSLISNELLTAASYDQLSHTAAALLAELHRRAVEDNDISAVMEEAFLEGFGSPGEANLPWIHQGLLICPGYIRHKSAQSHECSFANINNKWAWEADELIADTMRQLPGARVVRHSISILAPVEGMEIDVVESAARGGTKCQMRKVTSYQVRSGKLEQVTSRARSSAGHGSGL